jgi:hypothetical protein
VSVGAGVRIAMWSGPRNISTAMMRSFGGRADCHVSDEPFYAHYLAHTGKDHPGRDEVVAHHETDWREVARALAGPIPGGKAVWYQKHMSHHLLPHMGREWMLGLRHAFLIRAPTEMLASLARVLDAPALEDTGLPQQVDLYDWLVARTGRAPPVIDARDVLLDPRTTLARLCAALGIPFEDAMLHWPPGPRATDGIWAKHWYASVERSTGFEPYTPGTSDVPPRLHELLAQCELLYTRLHARRLS